MRKLNKWRVYLGDKYSRSYTYGIDAVKEVLDSIHGAPFSDEEYRDHKGELLYYSLRIEMAGGEVTVWEEGEWHEHNNRRNS